MPLPEEHNSGPALGETAPYFRSPGVDGIVSFENFKGNWTIIFSHPEDLMPVFKTRTVHYLLCKRKTKVIALGEGQTSEGNFLKKYVTKHCLTVLEDGDRTISKSYGVGAAGGKGVFVVDPKGVLRIKLYVPLGVTRDFYEILRLVDALQEADRGKKKQQAKGSWKSRLGIAGHSGSVVGQG